MRILLENNYPPGDYEPAVYLTNADNFAVAQFQNKISEKDLGFKDLIEYLKSKGYVVNRVEMEGFYGCDAFLSGII